MSVQTVQTSVPAPAFPAGAGTAPGDDRRRSGEAEMLQVHTLVLWLTCVAVSVLGLAVPHIRPRLPSTQSPPVVAQVVNVDVAKDQSAPPDAGPPSSEQPPAQADAMAPPSVPPLPDVAAPSAAIAFALPVEGPSRVVEPKRAVPVPAAPAPAPQPTLRRLTYGQGEGRQPAPDYPQEAIVAHEEGAVVVRFTVGEDGHVLAAEVATPCRFPALNQAALEAVRRRWQFGPGPLRLWEVSIRFQLNQR